jgi:GTP-binding protein HflX
VVVDHNLSPSQGRNLEKDLGMRVVDRTELILDIFATRAQTNQAKLQVELAQMEYVKTRLKRMWTHLERTEGAVGSRGPGETQLETDRRLVGAKVTSLKRRLKEIENRRHREAVAREYPYTVSLVGYTNSGKSSMLKKLTSADVYIADQLFATLDTRVRYWTLQDTRKVVLADTVGFVRDLPHNLVASFHATLEETINADLLVHLCDASDPDLELNIEAVNYQHPFVTCPE